MKWSKYVLFVEGDDGDFAGKLSEAIQQIFTKKNSVWAIWENGFPVALLRAAIVFYDNRGLLVVHCSDIEYIHKIAKKFAALGKLKIELVMEDYALP